MRNTAIYHLPGLFEFYELYRRFLPLFRTHREYFYDWCEIGSIYGAPENCLWGGGRFSCGECDPQAMMETLARAEKDKVEFLCNECCWTGCRDRRRCYEVVSRQNLGEDCPDHRCAAPDAAQGYRFSKAMRSPAFIGVEDIKETYLPMGFSNFKIEGRGLGSALVLEFLLYYLVKPEHQLEVREEIYLDNMLDLF